MRTTFKTVTPFTAAALALASLASCGKNGDNSTAAGANGAADAALASKLFPENFKGVCSGAPFSAATGYDPAAKAHKALYFATYKDDFSDHSSSLPADWTVQFSPTSDAFRAIDLVVCAKRTAAKEVKVCDKYKTEGKEGQNKVRWHTATYALSLWEAKTGKKVAETTLEATDTDCPMFENFQNDSDTVDDYASPSNSAVADFLKPHMVH